jgi:hypothetical protein
MGKRSGIYIVKTHKWYLERLVWLIAGIVLLIGSFLTLFHNINWAFSILSVGIFSVIVSLTGFCIVGNILYRLGVPPMLPTPVDTGNGGKHKLYFMQTDIWYLERYIYLIVGVNLSIAALLIRIYTPYWLIFPGFVGGATIVFSFTGFCILANLLYRLGAEPRLCRNL